MTANLSLFEKPAPVDPSMPPLWPHQAKAVGRIAEELREARSTLLVMATGTGKSRVAADVIDAVGGRALFLVHRDTLLQQAVQRMGLTGRRVGIEKASNYASKADDTVVATVQSIGQPGRLASFDADEFRLLVCDEAHRSVSATWRRIVDHFKSAKLLGVTATPDRADRLALGQVYDTVAYVYDILDGIQDGVLCKINCVKLYCKSLKLDDVKTVAGDFDQEELDRQLGTDECLDEVAKPLVVDRIAGDRRGLVFTSSVATAHALVGRFNRYVPGCARAVDGGMPYAERNENMRCHRNGEYQWLINVDVLTEGYDDPQVACVANARPTKSRIRYAQAVGRGTRIAPGKDNLLIVDFTSASKKHKLITPVDILAGKYSDDVQAEAAEMLGDEAIDPQEALKRAAANIKSRAQLAQAAAEAAAQRERRVSVTSESIDPFGLVDMTDPGADGFDGQFGKGVPASEKQQRYLYVLGFNDAAIAKLSKKQASVIIDKYSSRRDHGWVSHPQHLRTLKLAGYETKGMRLKEAMPILHSIWGNKPPPPHAAKFSASLPLREREVGEEG